MHTQVIACVHGQPSYKEGSLGLEPKSHAVMGCYAKRSGVTDEPRT